MGHIFRALMLAHEIADHKVTFLCTRESELAAANIAARDYRTKIQRCDDLADDVLALKPDLVINDILNTNAAYMRSLKTAGIRAVNFEDLGEGAALADLVVNALYDADRLLGPHVLYGYRYFCLRDEFLHSRRNLFRHPAQKALVTFGGTDHSDFTRKTLDALLPLCRAQGITMHLVAGPGYAHREALEKHLAELAEPLVHFTAATNVMSQVMEGADLAVCSAGRTLYELAHMRIPALVLAHHEREAMHTFARQGNGFEYLGHMARFDAEAMRKAFLRLLDKGHRHELYARMARFDFTRNKGKVVKRIVSLLRD
jgi:spore coat polysaccharide biosynthesis predicted glycosyltransferase SpsG